MTTDALHTQRGWMEVTVPMLEEARRRVRSLARLIERVKRKTVYTDFTDELGELTELPLLPGSGQVNGERFRAKACEFLRHHEDHIAIHKLHRNIAPLQHLTHRPTKLCDSGGHRVVGPCVKG